MKLMYLAVAIAAAMAAQPPIGGPGGSGSSPPSGGSLEVSATANAADLPIGFPVSASCLHDEITHAKYQWEGRCNGSPWSVAADWRTSAITTDCIGNPGVVDYKVTVSGKNQLGVPVSGTDTATVVMHAPDTAKLFLKDVNPTPPSPGNAAAWLQMQFVELSWNGTKLGKCAKVCCKEWVKISASDPRFRELEVERAFPTTCMEDGKGGYLPVVGATGYPADVTSWEWKSPHLYDLQAVWMNNSYLSILNSIQAPVVPPQKPHVIATKIHKYFFSGFECGSGKKWEFIKSYKMNLVVHNINGQNTPVWEKSE